MTLTCLLRTVLSNKFYPFDPLGFKHNPNEYTLVGISFKHHSLFLDTLRNNMYILQAGQLQKSRNYEELFDEKLGSNINKEEAEIMVKIALLCTNGSPSIRPIMSEVVSMLEGRTCVPEIDPEAGGYTDDLRSKAMRDFREDKYKKNSRSQHSTSAQTDPLFSVSSYDYSEIEPVETR
ncbi:putative non-specific serine/threonine protein kinase [Helianthus anomalus]